jgi:uncharacterized membrane protein
MIPIRTVLAVLLVVGIASAQEPPAGARRYTIVAPWKEGLNAVALNGRGDLTGFHLEPRGGNPDVLEESPFLARDGQVVRLPLLATYTATFPAGLSDGGIVVGRASKPIRFGAPNPLASQAFVWTAEAGIRGLGAAEPDVSSLATGIGRDGRRIAGIGSGPAGLRAVLWERDGDGWKAVVLPGGDGLESHVLPISPDGRRLAALRRGRPTLWTETTPGRWDAQTLDGGQNRFAPRGVNDGGTVVGVRHEPDGTRRAVVWTPGRGATILEPPPGYVHGEASAINAAGTVVGQVDGPHGRAPGPRAFVHEAGRLRLLDEGGPHFAWATTLNDAGQVSGVLEEPEVPEAEAGPNAPPAGR